MLDLPDIAPSPWRPKSLSPPTARASIGRHAWLLALVIIGHVGALFLIARGMASPPVPADDVVTEARFITPLPSKPEPVMLEETGKKSEAKTQAHTLAAHAPARRKTPEKKPRDNLVAIENTPASVSPSNEPLQIFDANGRVKLPDGLMEKLDGQSGDKRVFDYQVPGLATSGKFFDRPPALAYDHNRFEQYYRPDQDLLTELLTRLVESTTKEVRIKIPGNPRAKIVCKVSLLAMGGGCGVQQNQGNYVIADDPNTLSEEEQAQCQAWWSKIVDAGSQDIWRKTRDMYDTECRKPLERKPPVPKGMEPMPGRIVY